MFGHRAIGPNVSALNSLTSLIERGELRPIVGAEFALHDVQRAHELSEKVWFSMCNS